MRHIENPKKTKNRLPLLYSVQYYEEPFKGANYTANLKYKDILLCMTCYTLYCNIPLHMALCYNITGKSKYYISPTFYTILRSAPFPY
jgi:hypothetical protein